MYTENGTINGVMRINLGFYQLLHILDVVHCFESLQSLRAIRWHVFELFRNINHEYDVEKLVWNVNNERNFDGEI